MHGRRLVPKPLYVCGQSRGDSGAGHLRDSGATFPPLGLGFCFALDGRGEVYCTLTRKMLRTGADCKALSPLSIESAVPCEGFGEGWGRDPVTSSELRPLAAGVDTGGRDLAISSLSCSCLSVSLKDPCIPAHVPMFSEQGGDLRIGQ